MKVIDNYIIKEIAGNYVAVPDGATPDECKRMLHLNETGTFIWRILETDTTYDNLLNALINEYEVNSDQVSIIQNDLNEFLNQMRLLNLLIE